MKKIIFTFLLFTGTLLSKAVVAQDFNTPVAYMDYISKQHVDIAKKFLSYNSAVSHGKRARKVENLRTKLIDEVENARENISSMPPYNGDKKYRDSVVAFMKFYYNLLNDDYAKIVNMEDIAEQSYDDMEAYILLKEQVDKKMDQAEDHMHAEEVKFAAKNNVNLVDGKSNLNEMMETVAKVNEYYNVIYLVFFKSYKEEGYLWDAINKKNVTAIEQDKNVLLQYAKTGLATLDTTKSFEGDNSLVTNCRSLLKFYTMEVNNKIGSVSDYLLKQEQFAKMATDYENKSEHSKDDVNTYNKSVKEINEAVNSYNTTNNELNKERDESINNWNNAVNTYFAEQTPKYH